MCLIVRYQSEEGEDVQQPQERSGVLLRGDHRDCSLELDRQWRITSLDENAKKRLGLDDRCVGRSLWELFPLSSASYAREILEECVEQGQSAQFPYYGPELGSWFQIEVKPLAKGLRVEFRDRDENGSAAPAPQRASATTAELAKIALEMRRMADQVARLVSPTSKDPESDLDNASIDDQLSRAAEAIYRDRRRRGEILGVDSAEPQWDILLHLFVEGARGNRVSVTGACIAADVPPTTASRALEQLAQSNMVARYADHQDRRRSWLELTERGKRAMRRFLRQSCAATHTF